MHKQRAFTPLEMKISNRANDKFLTGFTLIELLVVVSIIALLMVILMPALTRARDQTKDAVCMTNLRQWGIVFEMYTQNNNGFFNTGYYPGIPEDPVSSFAGGHRWPITLLPYYLDRKLRFCPMATKSFSQGAPVRFTAWIAPDLDNPDDMEYKPQGSYGVNEWISNPPVDADWEDESDYGKYWKRPGQKGAAKIPMMLDSWWAGCRVRNGEEPPPYEGWVTLGSPRLSRWCINRHNMSVNGLFMDFSVRKVGLRQLWQLKWHRTFDSVNGPWTPGGGCELADWPKWMRNSKDYY